MTLGELRVILEKYKNIDEKIELNIVGEHGYYDTHYTVNDVSFDNSNITLNIYLGNEL